MRTSEDFGGLVQISLFLSLFLKKLQTRKNFHWKFTFPFLPLHYLLTQTYTHELCMFTRTIYYWIRLLQHTVYKLENYLSWMNLQGKISEYLNIRSGWIIETDMVKLNFSLQVFQCHSRVITGVYFLFPIKNSKYRSSWTFCFTWIRGQGARLWDSYSCHSESKEDLQNRKQR